MKTVSIIDSCMMDYSGHHADINLRLAREFVKRGCKVIIYANKKFVSKDPDLDIRPLFSYGAYEFIAKLSDQVQSNSPMNIFQGMSAIFEGEAARIIPSDLSIIPTLFAHQLFAISAPAISLGKVFAAIHTPPTFKNPDGAVFWKMAFLRAQAKGAELRLGVFEPELLLEYESFMPHGGPEIEEFPIPHDGSDFGSLRKSLVTVGLLGHQRSDKGLSDVSRTINACNAMGLKVTVQDSAGRMGKVLNQNPDLKILGYVDNMGKLIRQCDATLLNYSPEFYRFSGSGIAWESLASGVPVLAPKGTSISRLLRAYDAGATFLESDKKSKFQALDAMRRNYEQHLQRALQARDKFKEKHSTSRFVDLVIGEAQPLDRAVKRR